MQRLSSSTYVWSYVFPFSDCATRITAGKENPANKNFTYGDTALLNAEKIMKLAERYAAKGNQTAANLVHLNDDIIVGEWRDSTYGKDNFVHQRAVFLPCRVKI